MVGASGQGCWVTAPASRRLIVVRSLPLFSRGGPKWRDKYPEGPDHTVATNRLEIPFSRLQKEHFAVNRYFLA